MARTGTSRVSRGSYWGFQWLVAYRVSSGSYQDLQRPIPGSPTTYIRVFSSSYQGFPWLVAYQGSSSSYQGFQQLVECFLRLVVYGRSSGLYQDFQRLITGFPAARTGDFCGL